MQISIRRFANVRQVIAGLAVLPRLASSPLPIGVDLAWTSHSAVRVRGFD